MCNIKLTTHMLVSSNLRFHLLLSHGRSPQCLPCPFLLGFAIWSRVFYQLHALRVLMGSFNFIVRIVANLLCYLFVCLMQPLSYMLCMKNVQ